MTDSGPLSQAGQAKLATILKNHEGALRKKGAQLVQMEFSDINGYTRGKIANLHKGLSASGTGVSSLISSILGNDNFVETPFSNFQNSFPKMVAVPDPDTVTHWSWQPDMASVLCDLYMEDGSPCPLDPRHMLRSVLARYRALGIEPQATLEYELYIYEDNPELIAQKRYKELAPHGRAWDFYSISRPQHFGNLAREFFQRMESIGIEIEAFHTEYGYGMYEYVHGLADPLTAADAAVRGKLYLKQLCTEMGLFATFMARPGMKPGDSSSGAHHNVSIWQDGKNLLWDPKTGTLSKTARHFSAGILAAMPDLHLIFRPWVNSYRRMNRFQWNPENASWGLDNHTVAIRVIHGGVPSKHSRLEHRVAGADVNPYLTMAAILLSGLRGIERELEPPPYTPGDAGLDHSIPRLPSSLKDSIATFQQSRIARELFGDQFVDHFALVKDGERQAYESWSQEHNQKWADGVNDWEYERYLMWV